MGDRGNPTQNHMDHVHDSFEESGSATPVGGGNIGLTCEQQIWMYGSSGDCVIGIQDHLNRHGASLDNDGDFGSITQTAVKDFQKAHGLADDGVVGARTWETLLTGIAPAPIPIPPPVPVPPATVVPPLPRLMWKGMEGDDVKQVQERLIAHGHRLEADGIFGAETRARVIIHQAAWKLDADGVVGPDTWATLWVNLP